jgi:protein SCO1/2
MHRWTFQLLLLLTIAGVAGAADDAIPAGLQNVGIEEKLNAQLPLDAVLSDELGNRVALRDCIMPGKPAVLQLGYFGCPMLCDTISQGMLRSMKELDLQIGRDFSVIFISFDPRETRVEAYQKKRSYVQQYDRPGSAKGWHFLVADKATIKAVTDAVGFKFKWDDETNQFSHSAAIMMISPEGKVSRYLYGVDFPKRTMRLSLVEASEGKIATTTDRMMMFCFRYDSSTGKYTLAVMNLMRAGAVVTVIALAAVVTRLLLKERRASRTGGLAI